MVPTRKRTKKSRRAWPRRLHVEMALCGSPLDAVAALPVLALRGHELELNPLGDRAAEVATDRMRQPAGSSHWLFQRSAVRPPQHCPGPWLPCCPRGHRRRGWLFGGLLAFGPPFGRAGFLPGLGLAGAIRRFRAATLARLVAFGGCTVAAAGGLACSSAFDVIVNLLIRQMPDSGHPSLRCSSKASDIRHKTLRISLIFSGSFPNM